MTRNLALLVGLALLACAPRSESPTSTEILWDEWGVPHIFASDEESLLYALGWAQARAHGDLLLELYGKARGRAAEYWGSDEYLESDRWIRTMGAPDRAARWYEQQGAAKGLLDAFADGINAYARQHPDQIADRVEVVLPVDGVDVLAHSQRVLLFTFVVDPRQVRTARTLADRLAETKGSNAWAIAPQRSASGNAILVANPHLPWGDLFTWFEVQLTSAEIDAYGATLVGNPFHGIAFNDHLGWTHTVNTHDGFDLFELTLTDDGYAWDDGSAEFEVESQTLRVLQKDGTVEDQKLTIKRSIHGPVIAESGNKAIALRVVGLEAPAAFEQYWKMSQATSLEEFQEAQARLQMPMFTTIYADREGHVMHHFGGETPVRSSGDWGTWQQPVPGNLSEWLWTEVHPYEELPTAIDPPSGWLQNANDPPWTTTFPAAISADAYPAYMAPRFMHFRAQRSARMLMEDESIDFEEAVAYKHSTRMELADRILDDLLPLLEESQEEPARQAFEVLGGWDRLAEAESRGAVLFAAFAREMSVSASASSTPGRAKRRCLLRTGLAQPQAAVDASPTRRPVRNRAPRSPRRGLGRRLPSPA